MIKERPADRTLNRQRRALLADMLILALAASRWCSCLAQTDLRTAEYKVKAAFLYKIAGYVEWPPQAFSRGNAPIIFGVVGADALSDDMSQIAANRTVDGHPLTIRELGPNDPITGVHVLFLGHAASAQYARILAAAKGKPVLTVTESAEAFSLGSVINFVVENDKVRFDVALHQAKADDLKISARLLSVARKVIESAS